MIHEVTWRQRHFEDHTSKAKASDRSMVPRRGTMAVHETEWLIMANILVDHYYLLANLTNNLTNHLTNNLTHIMIRRQLKLYQIMVKPFN